MIGRTLDELITECLVQVNSATGFGTGFFVADRTVITCSHVVQGTTSVDILWREQRLTGHVVKRIPEDRGDGHYYRTPDIAVVELTQQVAHPSVWLANPNERLTDGLVVMVHGFSAQTPRAPQIARDARRLTVGGLLEDDCLRVTADNVAPGMSGSLVLDERTRRVCGIVKASVDHGGVVPAGGWIVSVAAFARYLPELVAANWQASVEWRNTVDPGPRYLAEVFAKDMPPVIELESERVPSYYLDPRRQIARFLHRPELDELADWCQRDTSGVVRLIHGPGGAGKTRLSVQLMELMGQQPGWIAGRLANRIDVDLNQLVAALVGRKVLLCIDYAEDWAYVLPELLERVVGPDYRYIRILLLARTVGAWWRTLRAARHVKTLINPEPTHLGQLGKEIDRAEVLHCAYRDFREAICVDAPEEAPSVLINAAPGEANVLGLHAAALAVVLHTRDNAGQPPENTLDLRHPLGDLLNHERDWWQTWIDGQDVAADRAAIGPIIDKRDFSSRVLIVPTLYLAADANQAEAALVGVLSDGGFGTSLASKVAATLTKVYPNTRPDVQRHWDPLQPDRLGETLVLEVLDEAASKDHCIRLVCGIFDAGVDEAQAEQSLIVLARASGLASLEGAARATADTAVARQRAIDCIRALLERYPSAFLPAATTVAAGLPEPGPLIAVVRSVLQHADGEIPRRAARLIPRTIVALAPLEAALWQRCNELALEQMSKSSTVAQELDLANQYRWLSDAHERAEDGNAALVAIRSAVERYQHVVSQGRDDVIVDLVEARSLLAQRAEGVGHQDEALEQITRTIDTYQDLVQDDQSYRGTLLWARGFKDRLLRAMGRHLEADQESAEGKKDAEVYKRQVNEWLAKNMPQPVGDQVSSAVDRYGGPRPSFDDPDLQLVLPIGHFAGPMFTSPDAEVPESFEIRFRDGVFSLSAQEYAVWAVAHGDPEIVGSVPSTRAVVEYAARTAGVEHPEPLFASLVRDGLLVEAPLTGEQAHEFARRHQVMPLALGLGNTPGSLGAFQIGMPNAPRATVGYDVYHIWLFAHQELTLWEALSTIAQEASEANEEERNSSNEVKIELISDPEVLLTGFLRALPVLLSTSCIYLDRRA